MESWSCPYRKFRPPFPCLVLGSVLGILPASPQAVESLRPGRHRCPSSESSSCSSVPSSGDRSQLALENLALRQQLAILRHSSTPPPGPHPVSFHEAPCRQPPLAVIGVPGRSDLSMDGLLTHPRPEPARHSSPAAVLAGLDVVEMRHLLVEEGVADGAGRIFGRQHDNALTFDDPRLEAGARGPGGGALKNQMAKPPNATCFLHIGRRRDRPSTPPGTLGGLAEPASHTMRRTQPERVATEHSVRDQ